MSKNKSAYRAKVKAANSAANSAAAPTAKTAAVTPKDRQRLGAQIVKQNINRYRADIADWMYALRAAENVLMPNRTALINMYYNIGLDGLFTSQIANRKRGTTAAKYELVAADGTPNDEATALLQASLWFKELIGHILDATFWGHSLVQYDPDLYDPLEGMLIDRRHVISEYGAVKASEYDNDGTRYRETAEYSVSILEFGSKTDLGLLNKAVPYILMKKFAIACFSEYTEIFGMPPRIGKTNTDDPIMVGRMETMLRDMGSSATLVLDNSEEYEIVNGIVSDGLVYENLIRLLNNEISMLVSGAIIGQDTKNGNESKESLSIQILEGLIAEDQTNVVTAMNTTVLPALVAQGILPDGLRFKYMEEEDLDAKFEKVVQLMPYYDIDPQYIEATFGIPVLPKQQAL